MFSIHLYAFVVIYVNLQGNLRGGTARRIVVRQIDAENYFLDYLIMFARLGDPCKRLAADPDPEDLRLESRKCLLATSGYDDLPTYAKTRCKSILLDAGCKTHASRPGDWYCGAYLRRTCCGSSFAFALLVGFSKYTERHVDFSYCIGNLDLGLSDCWLDMDRIKGQKPEKKGNTKRTVVVPIDQENFYVKPLKKFLEVGDSCAHLDDVPDSDSIANADAQCIAAIVGYERLPDDAKERCKDVRKLGCKKEPHPSKKWCCGLVIEVEKTGFFACLFKKKTRSGIVALSYCTEGLTVLTPPAESNVATDDV